MKRIISICVPCRNEINNVEPLANEIILQMDKILKYDYEIIFIDNCSEDGTQDTLRNMCAKNKRIKAIINAKNFPLGSGMHVLFQASGDCIISIPADFQVPMELIPTMIEEWEKGAMAVALIKSPGKKDKLRGFRNLYYLLTKRLAKKNSLSGFTGSGAYDKTFIEMCKTRNNPMMNMNFFTMVSNYAAPIVFIKYKEQSRRSGKSNHGATALIDIAIKRFVSVSDDAPRYAIMIGMVMGLGALLVSIYYLIRKFIDWYNFPVGMAPLVIGVFFLGAMQLIFMGLIGEYILNINKRQMNEPFVIEKERINFSENGDELK
ncbi:MAG: glycosyltransferase [Oscillospiraceae bacterium]|nr:glycosyltransferase [Oscillospiraceae bacterium]